jgi:hypothetical protein
MHMAIAEWWPIPIHRGCRCKVTQISPGMQAQPFVDFRQILRGLPPEQQTAAVGMGVYDMLERGVIKWEDAVTTSRVRPLYEIVARERLTVAKMVEAGVNLTIAQEAFDTVNTPAHIAIDKKRQELFQKMRDAGLTNDEITEMLAPLITKQAFGTPGLPKLPLVAGLTQEAWEKMCAVIEKEARSRNTSRRPDDEG